MEVRFKPTSVIKARLGINPDGKVQRFFTNTCYRYMDKYVPYKEGNLRTQVNITPNQIIYNMPYAHAQYVGYTKGPVLKYTTPGTGPYWDKKMVSAEINNVIEEVQEYINNGGK